MLEWSAHRFFALFLGLWFALAPAIYAVPATAMMVQTSMSDDTGPGGCDSCPEDDLGRSLCALICLNAAQCATTADPYEMRCNFVTAHGPEHHPALLALLSTPDPAPPKPVTLR